ncbi:MAG: hydroxymethylglutaryl-CoA reductase, partial [Saprospiraceae bacterium]|nr:hydroxymethylglutaryl-CoA reductase [Saprospiraceae bacterium]
TIGIQKGHMKMHLHNILNHLQANDKEKELVFSHFEDKTVSFTSVRDFLYQIKTDANKNSTIIV